MRLTETKWDSMRQIEIQWDSLRLIKTEDDEKSFLEALRSFAEGSLKKLPFGMQVWLSLQKKCCSSSQLSSRFGQYLSTIPNLQLNLVLLQSGGNTPWYIRNGIHLPVSVFQKLKSWQRSNEKSCLKSLKVITKLNLAGLWIEVAFHTYEKGS